jgi:hypothetical protein
MISTMMRTPRTPPTAVNGVVPPAACADGGRTSKATVGSGVAQAVLAGAPLPAAVGDGEAVWDADVEAVGD